MCDVGERRGGELRKCQTVRCPHRNRKVEMLRELEANMRSSRRVLCIDECFAVLATHAVHGISGNGNVKVAKAPKDVMVVASFLNGTNALWSDNTIINGIRFSEYSCPSFTAINYATILVRRIPF